MSSDDPKSGDLDDARRGDSEALYRLLRRNEPRLRRVLEARLTPQLRARTRASDILQSTFLQVLRKIETFRGTNEEMFSAWVVRILENEVKDERRHFNAEKRRGQQDLTSEPVDGRTGRGGSHTPSSPLNMAEQFRAVQLALDALKDEDHRRVLLLRFVDKKSHREIAQELGRSEDATRQLFNRVKAAFLAEVARQSDRLRGE